MQAIILAAGIGNRLGMLGNRPKSLLEFGGQSLLARHLSILHANGISRVTICVGYCAEQIRAAADSSPIPVEFVVNGDYRRGSVVSLWHARAALALDEPVLLMDADVLYHPKMIRRLVESRHTHCFLLDREFVPGDEPVKLCVREGRLVEFRKKPDPSIAFDLCGESVGFFKFGPACAHELATRCDAYIREDRLDAPYEEPIRDLIQASRLPLGFEDITGVPWIEIDFPEDVERARDTILPQLGTSSCKN